MKTVPTKIDLNIEGEYEIVGGSSGIEHTNLIIRSKKYKIYKK